MGQRGEGEGGRVAGEVCSELTDREAAMEQEEGNVAEAERKKLDRLCFGFGRLHWIV